jgi:hypothetical protein
VRHVHQRLDVVDERRALVEALVGREGRLEARIAALALQGVEQGGLLAADVGARAAVDPQLQVEARAEDVVAEQSGGLGLVDRRLEDVGLVGVLAANEDERARGADRVGRDDHALDQRVRRLLHELAVLKVPGLGFVRVADEVLVHVALGHEGGLLAHGEAGAAAAAHVGRQQLVDDRAGLHLERLAQHLVAAATLVDAQGVEARRVDVREEELRGRSRGMAIAVCLTCPCRRGRRCAPRWGLRPLG